MNSDLKRVRDGQTSDDVTSGSPVLKKRSLGTPPRSEVKSEGMTGDWMEVVEVSLLLIETRLQFLFDAVKQSRAVLINPLD
jgi:hypothetical protein